MTPTNYMRSESEYYRYWNAVWRGAHPDPHLLPPNNPLYQPLQEQAPGPNPSRQSPPLIEDDGTLPRHSTRTRQQVHRPDNVYGNRNPADILRESEDDFYMPEEDQICLVPLERLMKKATSSFHRRGLT